MISVDRLRKIEPAFRDMTDEQVIKVRDLLEKFAVLAIEVYVERHGGSKYPAGSDGLPVIDM